jgi:uncharacterized protein
MDFLPIEVWAALVGLFGGGILGLAARLGEFCTLGALESAVYGQDQKRLRMWGIALGVAILGTFTLAEFGQLEISATIYHSIKWNPFASIFGGLLFGYGMAYAGNCGFAALARIGGGDLRALVVVIVMAIFSLMTLGGPLASLRVMMFAENPSEGYQGFAHLLSGLTSLSPLFFAAIIAFILILWALMHKGLRKARKSMFWAFMVGVAITSSWWGTSFLADYSLGGVAVQGLSYTAPLGRSLIYIMTSTAGGLSFAVGSVFGVIIGGFIGSMIKGHFRWEACEDPQELGRQMLGAALMGIGGVIALGCSIGQGLSAFSTLAYSAPVTIAAISAGGILGLRRLLSGFQPE